MTNIVWLGDKEEAKIVTISPSANFIIFRQAVSASSIIFWEKPLVQYIKKAVFLYTAKC